MNHLTLENMLAYITGKMKEEKMLVVEEHIADCDECAKKIYIYNIIKENFDEVWDTLTLKEQARVGFLFRILEAIAKLEIPAPYRERVIRWAKRIFEKTEIILDISFNIPNNTVKITQESLKKFFKPYISPQFYPVPVPSWVKGNDARKISKSIETRDPYWFRVTADPLSKKISVQREIGDKPWPLILLLSKTGESKLGEYYHPPETEYLLCEFENLPPGEYFLTEIQEFEC